MDIRIGNGIDVHKFAKGENFILGGININYDFGILAHSDGDIVIHALIDSILGGLSLGDIGTYFPSNNNQYKNADSKLFLKFALKKLKEEKYEINNIDINIILESPKLNRYIEKMQQCLSNIINIDINLISIIISYF